MGQQLSPAMLRALSRAAERPQGYVCPIIGAYAAAEQSLLDAMERRGFVCYPADRGGKAPVITDAGRAALAKARGES